MRNTFTNLNFKATNDRLRYQLGSGVLLLLFLLVAQVASAQQTIAISPTCKTAGGASFTLTINSGSGAFSNRSSDNTVQVSKASNFPNDVATTSTTTNISRGPGPQSLQVTVPASFISSAGTLYVRYRTGSATSYTYSNIVVLPVSDPNLTVGTITGPTNLCGGSTVTYTVPAVPGAVSYSWNVPVTATYVGSSSGNSITLNLENTNLESYVRVRANYCGGTQSSNQSELAVKVREAIFLTAGNILTDTDDPDDELIIGESATFLAQSEMIDIGRTESDDITYDGDVASYRWFTSNDGINWNAVENSNSKSLYIASIPPELNSVKVELIPREEIACYSNLPSDGYQTIISGELSTFPVEIIYFNASRLGNQAVLEWATASEQNNAGFEVQVSADGEQYSKLAFIPTKNGNSNTKQVYTFTDTEGGKHGTRYYRLKQLDTNGAFEYFGPKAVTFGNLASQVIAFPNPFQNEVTLDIAAEKQGEALVLVTDAVGKKVLERRVQLEKGFTSEKLRLKDNLPKGLYIIRTQVDGVTQYIKMIKE